MSTDTTGWTAAELARDLAVTTRTVRGVHFRIPPA